MTLHPQAEIMARAMGLLINATNNPRPTKGKYERVPTGYVQKLKVARSTLTAEQLELVKNNELDALPRNKIKGVATFDLVRTDTSRYQGDVLVEIKKRPTNAKQMRRRAAQAPLALSAE